MPIAAVFFDIGGVLERVGDIDDVLGAPWRDRLGLDQAEFSARLARVDPDRLNQVGRMSEAGFRERCAAELGLSQAEASAFMADLWDWYCGELACARLDLAPEETIFVDDYPGHVEAARKLGMHALAHVSTPQTIAAVNAALGG